MKKIFKRISAAVIALAVMLTAVVFDAPENLAAAAVGVLETDGYQLDDNGTLTIKNNDGMTAWRNVSRDYGATVNSIVIQSGVTSICDRAFNTCKYSTSISIPESVTKIGSYAFSGCSMLQSINIPDTVTSIGDSAFSSCSKLERITIPDAVTSIGGSAFSGCTGLRSVNIPVTLTSIKRYTFQNCSSLESINIPMTVTSIDSKAFGGCSSLARITVDESNINYSSEGGVLFNKDKKALVYYPGGKEDSSYTIPNNVTSIQSHAFSDCERLKSITIPNSVTSIGTYAFADCSSIESVTFSDGSRLLAIIDNTFYGCKNLSSINIPDSVTSIGADAFASCAKLQHITIPSSVTTIEIGDKGSPFRSCSALQEIVVEAGNTAFSFEDNVLFNADKTKLICFPAGLEGSYEIPDGVTSIETGAFYDCTKLMSVIIPSGVTSIGSKSFYFCKELASVTIPSSVTSIGNSAFSSCSKLNEIIYPSSATVGSSAIYPKATQVKYTETDSKRNVTEIALGTNKTSLTVTDAMGISFVADAERSKVSGEGHTHIYEDLSGAATDNCVICNDTAVKHIHGVCGVSGCTDPNHPAGHTTEITWTKISDENGLKTMTDGGHYYLAADITLTDQVQIASGVNVTLCLNGQTIKAAKNKRIFEIDGSTLTLCDCGTEGKLTGGNVSSGSGGAVDMNSGTFNMYGGEITKNTANNGGGVSVLSGMFNMYGGKITDNSTGTGGVGGGVKNLSTFNMYGGTISGNFGKSQGGGVYSNTDSDGVFNMCGGEIIGNKSNNGGGGVYNFGDIKINNTVKITDNFVWNGDSGEYNVPNNVYLHITNNQYTQKGKPITLGDNFSTNSVIGVTHCDYPTCSAPVDIATGENIGANAVNSFVSDIEGYTVALSEDNKLQLTVPHNFEGSEWTITKAPTAAATGTAQRSCTNCNTIETKTLPQINLSGSGTAPEGLTVETKQPTMTEAGEIKYKEDETGNVIAIVEIPALNAASGGTSVWTKADVGEGENQSKNPTATEKGSFIFTSDKFGTITVEVPALSDTDVWTKDDIQHVDPTEEAEGKDVYTSDYGSVEVTIPKLGHTLTHVPAVPATETTAGTKEHWHCSGCGKDFANEDGTTEMTATDLTIPVTGHTHTLTRVPEVPATETTAGTKEHWHCSGCGKDFADANGTKEVTVDDLKTGKIKTEVQAPANVPKPEIATPKDELIEAALTEDEQKKVDEGTDIKIILKIEDTSDIAHAEDKSAVETAINGLENYKLGQYLDVTLLKIIGEQQEQKITNTNKPITITFEIPENLRGKAKYSVIRVHNGETTILEDKDNEPNTVTIETDRFSTYALVYRDKASASESGNPSTGTAVSLIPLAAAAAILTLALNRKKK